MLDSLLCAFGALAIIIGSIGLGIGILAFEGCIEERRRRRQRRTTVVSTRYAATRSIRDIKRQAIHELLDAERRQHAGFCDVIEGTAVEVKR